ncbi:MAG TPA: bifunctional 4-hydroxy-2-oxoglutarate aldolase/2-dehydro-3-deoxy-phosphogluconate aldolase [Candidatus Lokiarchaeia archaeon]|nr:bifunctional 4-hydroxy-2-oxoglutarate aldolase/2-dehydro-3-deoxy-phosphogluconate aldolase [Candidatus Lokiarchaeia archaeon]
MSSIESVIADLENARLVAIVTIPDATLAVPLAKALIAGGVKIMEITFRNDQAEAALKELQAANLPINYGAGTVRSIEQAEIAVEAGANFLISPGFNDAVIKWALDNNIPFFPGVDSTAGIEKACDAGMKVLKFFPAAELGGPKWLKAMKDPYFDINFIPTGGVSLENLKEYLSLPNVTAVGGTFLAPKDLIQAQQFAEITAICKKAVAIVKSLNKKQ